MMRESQVSIPYHRPRQLTLAKFLDRRKAIPVVSLHTTPEELSTAWQVLNYKHMQSQQNSKLKLFTGYVYFSVPIQYVVLTLLLTNSNLKEIFSRFLQNLPNKQIFQILNIQCSQYLKSYILNTKITYKNNVTG